MSDPILQRPVDWAELSADSWADAAVAWDQAGAPFTPRFVEKRGILYARDAECSFRAGLPCRCVFWRVEAPGGAWVPDLNRHSRLAAHAGVYSIRSDHAHVLWAWLTYHVLTELYDLSIGPRMATEQSQLSNSHARRIRKLVGLSYINDVDRSLSRQMHDLVLDHPLQDQIDALETLDHGFGKPEPEPRYAMASW